MPRAAAPSDSAPTLISQHRDIWEGREEGGTSSRFWVPGAGISQFLPSAWPFHASVAQMAMHMANRCVADAYCGVICMAHLRQAGHALAGWLRGDAT